MTDDVYQAIGQALDRAEEQGQTTSPKEFMDIVKNVFAEGRANDGEPAATDTCYRVVEVQVPALLVVRDGRQYIEIVDGQTTYRAPLGDGRWFFRQVVEKLVDPALESAYASPND